MEIEDFMKRTQPRARRSKLEPFQEGILLLKAKGYANGQVREWLLSNGVEISQEAVRKFINKHQVGSSPAVAKIGTLPEPASSSVVGNVQDAEEQDNIQTVFNPSDLRKSLTKKVDLEALSKLAKQQRKDKK
jgi:hypothetical protein